MLHKGRVNGRRRGMAIQRVHAPAAAVWSRILDFGAWPKMVDNVVSSHVYDSDGRDIKVEVVIGVSLVKIRTFVHHVYNAERSCMTWRLDPAHESDVDQNEGFWAVQEDESDLRWSVVYYSVSLRLKSWAPAWVDKLLAAQGLPKAVAWVKRESEARLKRRIQSSPALFRLGQLS